MIPYFRALGERIEQRWRQQSYNEESFSRLALAELEREPPRDRVTVEEVIDWVFGHDSQELGQPNTSKLFGQPPVTVFQAPRFYIEALFWLSGTTAIHEHGFSGAFAVLAGSSVHSHWRFERERTISSRMLCGRLERVSTEILRPGAMRRIRSGNRLIHQLFHLEMPSVTIVVRTNSERNRLPQYEYRSPGLAIDPEDHEPWRIRRLILLDSMARGHLKGLGEHARKLIEAGDLETMYHMFSTLARAKADKNLLAELYRGARERHGEVIDLFHEVCETERRVRIVSVLRGKVTDPGARFLLALLMLMPDREAVLETVRLQLPDAEPTAAIEEWVSAMSGKGTIGFEMNEVNRLIFRGLVTQLDTESLLRQLAHQVEEGSLAENRERVLAHARDMARSELFLPLFSGSPLRAETREAQPVSA